MVLGEFRGKTLYFHDNNLGLAFVTNLESKRHLIITNPPTILFQTVNLHFNKRC